MQLAYTCSKSTSETPPEQYVTSAHSEHRLI